VAQQLQTDTAADTRFRTPADIVDKSCGAAWACLAELAGACKSCSVSLEQRALLALCLLGEWGSGRPPCTASRDAAGPSTIHQLQRVPGPAPDRKPSPFRTRVGLLSFWIVRLMDEGSLMQLVQATPHMDPAAGLGKLAQRAAEGNPANHGRGPQHWMALTVMHLSWAHWHLVCSYARMVHQELQSHFLRSSSWRGAQPSCTF
jgi:hypothetical protein